MSDTWNNDPMQQSTPPAESTDSTAPTTPLEPTTPAEPATPQTPPANGFAPDGSYRYVPPRASQPTPPPYTAPPQGNYYYQTPPQQTPPPHKKGNGWMVALAVLAACAVLMFGVFGAFALMRGMDTQSTGEDQTTQTKPNTDSDNGVGDEQELVITPGGAPDDIDPETDYYYGDGGLSTETIVSKNNNSTVVLTMYSENATSYFGESGLREVGAGSGIVWTADGYIITNCHCAINESTGEAYDRIDITLYDGTVYEDAKVVGADESTDLAVIKVDATDLDPAEFGDSSELEVGSRVVALGNAAGLSWTATQGIVSAKARDVYEDTGYALQCLQVDVAINSGNSGGPLLNKFGQVVAINSAKIAAAGYEGLGFSIPITEAKPILESLKTYGYVKGRVSLGITGSTYDDDFYHGFAIATIEDDAGWKNTDVDKWEYAYDRQGRATRMTLIVGVNRVDVVDYGTLRAELAKYKVGDTVTLTLLHYDRNAEERITTHYVEVTLQEQTEN